MTYSRGILTIDSKSLVPWLPFSTISREASSGANDAIGMLTCSRSRTVQSDDRDVARASLSAMVVIEHAMGRDPRSHDACRSTKVKQR